MQIGNRGAARFAIGKPLLPCLLALSLSAHAAPAPITVVEGISEYRLPSGLRVLLFPDPSAATVTVNITYFVGSRHEGYGETGMAHLLEHMQFKGTDRNQNPWALLEGHGAEFNASTEYDRTNYFETMPATPDNLDFALRLEADRMVHSHIARADLDKEFSVVRNEFEAGENSPQQVLEQRMFESAYLFHNYGKPVIGSRSDIERVPIPNLRAFYQRYYQPDNAMLVVAGHFDPQKALGVIQASFGPIPRPARPLPATYTVEPVQDGERTVLLRRVGDVGMAALMYHGLAGADPGFVAEEAVVDLLVEKPAGRLYRALVPGKLAAKVDGDAYALKEPGVLVLRAYVNSDGQVERARDAMIKVVEDLHKEPPAAIEVQRFQARALKAIELDLADSKRVGIELSEWAAMGDWRLLFLHRDRVRALTPEAVRGFVDAYLVPSNRTVGLFLPDKAPRRSPLPPVPDVAAMVKDYRGQAGLSQGEVFETTVENVERHTQRLTLQSGMQVALLPKKTRGGVVTLSLEMHVGSEADLKDRTELAALIGPMLLRGTKKHSFQQIRDELDRLRAEIHIGAEGGGASGLRAAPRELQQAETAVHIRAVRETLPEVLALLAEILREPTFPAAEFETVRREALARLEARLQDPVQLAINHMLRDEEPYPPGDVRYTPTPQEAMARIKRIRAADLLPFHRAVYGGAGAALAVVGDFDPAVVRAALERGFGDWRAPRPYVRIDTPYLAHPTAAETIRTPDKEMALVLAGQTYPVRDDDPDYPALLLGVHILGSSVNSRLMNRLRQRDGLSYGTFSQIGASAFDRRADFFAAAICAPQNAQRAMVGLMEEIQRLVQDGAPDLELAEAKRTYLLGFATRLASDEELAGLLSRELHVGRTLSYYGQQNAQITALSGAALGQALRKIVDPQQLIRIIAGDVDKKR